MTDPIFAITVWQPWATLIAYEAKLFEFRHWEAPGWVQGRRVAIHAGARPTRKAEVVELLVKLQNPAIAPTTGIAHPAIAIDILERALSQGVASLPLASVLCTAVMGKPICNAELMAALGVV